MRVLFPDRIVNRHVGGNTTYARSLSAELEARGIETGVIPSGRTPLTTMLRETVAGLRKSRSDVLHYSADTGPLVHTRTPSVLTVHGVASRWIHVARTLRQESVWRYRVDRAIRSTDQLITVSQSSARDISEVFGVSPERISVIPHGVDTSALSVPTEPSPKLRASLPREFALYLGNVEPRKNLVELVKAFQLPELIAAGLPLVIAGRKAFNYEEAMMAITAADNVIYVGFVSESDRIALLQRCAVFVFPSLYEGFGFPVLEALAAGAPVVASRRGALEEVAGPSFPIARVDSIGIADAISHALTDDAWRNASLISGREWVAGFGWSESVDAHIEVYRRVLGR